MKQGVFLFISLLCLVTVAGTQAIADPLRVINSENFDEKELDVPKGETAAVKIYLKSSGDELKDYRVRIWRIGDQAPLQEQRTNALGEAWFFGIPAGNFRLSIDDHSSPTNFGAIQIGDFQLYLSSKVPKR